MKYNKLKSGEILSATYYMTVVDKVGDGILVRDQNNREFTVTGKKLIETMNSNLQYESTETVGKTVAAELLSHAGDSVFRVTYKKQDGKERTLTGRLMTTESLLGRSHVQDLEITSGNPTRQVDHRTISELVLRGVKYVVHSAD